jgi:hypothetical protein
MVPIWLVLLLCAAASGGGFFWGVFFAHTREDEPDVDAAMMHLPSLDELAGPSVSLPAPDATTSQRMAAIEVEHALAVCEQKGRFGP